MRPRSLPQVLLLSLVCLGGCGSDEGNGTSGGGDAGGTDGGSSIPNVYDCDSPPLTSCDNIICSTNLARAAIELACSQPNAPAECEGTVDECFADYLACVRPACPPGVDFSMADDVAVEACADDLDACTDPITGGG